MISGEVLKYLNGLGFGMLGGYGAAGSRSTRVSLTEPDEDQSQTGRELLTRLQSVHPDAYPDGVLRTVQRRLKIWRAEVARQLVFGAADGALRSMAPDALRDTEASRVGGHRPQPSDMNEARREHSVEATT